MRPAHSVVRGNKNGSSGGDQIVPHPAVPDPAGPGERGISSAILPVLLRRTVISTVVLLKSAGPLDEQVRPPNERAVTRPDVDLRHDCHLDRVV